MVQKFYCTGVVPDGFEGKDGKRVEYDCAKLVDPSGFCDTLFKFTAGLGKIQFKQGDMITIKVKEFLPAQNGSLKVRGQLLDDDVPY